MVKKFIRGAIKKPSAFRKYVRDTFGKAGFTKRGTVRPEITQKLASGMCPVCFHRKCVCPDRITQKRAVLARTLGRLRA